MGQPCHGHRKLLHTAPPPPPLVHLAGPSEALGQLVPAASSGGHGEPPDPARPRAPLREISRALPVGHPCVRFWLVPRGCVFGCLAGGGSTKTVGSPACACRSLSFFGWFPRCIHCPAPPITSPRPVDPDFGAGTGQAFLEMSTVRAGTGVPACVFESVNVRYYYQTRLGGKRTSSAEKSINCVHFFWA